MSSPGIFATETIERYMAESLEQLPAGRVKNFVPLFVHRFARERLRALGQAEGKITKDVPEVLFVCVAQRGPQPDGRRAAGQARRRPRARALRRLGARRARSTRPRSRRWRELGVDLSQEFPKPMTDEVVQAADAVITMGCGDACPIYPGKRYEDWELDDPAGQDLDGGAADPRRDRASACRALLAELVD